jgi:hypothetical protein
MRTSASAAALALLLVTGPAAAQPGPLVTQLMETPVTLFSFGMMRLQLKLDALGRDHRGEGELVGTVRYDWDESRLWIEVDRTLARPSREACQEVLNLLRGRGGVHLREADTYTTPWAEGSSYAALFRHVGFTEERLPHDLERRLDAIIWLRATLYDRAGGFTGDPAVRCESRLTRPDETRFRE